VPSPCNPLVEDYTEVLYIISKRVVLTVQCEMNLTWPNSMTEVDDPSFIFIDFQVTALASRLYRIQTALQLSENITLFAIYVIYTSVIGKEGQINT
jgi:hypothetical protein